MREQWLVIGHGSVGGSLVNRLLAAGSTTFVYDPQPRVLILETDTVVRVTEGPLESVDYIALCVPAAAAAAAARLIRDAVLGEPPVFDWTSALPEAKKEAAAMVSGSWVDIALLDSLDKEDEFALLAVSGPRQPRTAMCSSVWASRWSWSARKWARLHKRSWYGRCS